MTNRERLLRELEHVPEERIEEVIDFVQFLQDKARRSAGDTAILSESSLAKEWLNPEEDRAWAGL
jgi:hypothetical protein